MRQYANLFLLPFLAIISITVLSGFGSVSDTGTVKELLKERTSIMQQVYYGELDKDAAEERLSKIETQPLLEADIISLRQAENTEIDIVSDMEIITLSRTTKLYDYLSYHGVIKWYMTGMNGEYEETVDYCIVLKTYGQYYKLSDFYTTNHYQ